MVEGKTQTIKNRQRTKHTRDSFDQWPQLRGNGFHIVTTWHLFANTPPVQHPPPHTHTEHHITLESEGKVGWRDVGQQKIILLT